MWKWASMITIFSPTALCRGWYQPAGDYPEPWSLPDEYGNRNQLQHRKRHGDSPVDPENPSAVKTR